MWSITVNSYMITSFLRDDSDNSAGKMVGIPVSIREEDKGMSNQTSGIAVRVQYNRKQSFEEKCIPIMHNRDF